MSLKNNPNLVPIFNFKGFFFVVVFFLPLRGCTYYTTMTPCSFLVSFFFGTYPIVLVGTQGTRASNTMSLPQSRGSMGQIGPPVRCVLSRLRDRSKPSSNHILFPECGYFDESNICPLREGFTAVEVLPLRTRYRTSRRKIKRTTIQRSESKKMSKLRLCLFQD